MALHKTFSIFYNTEVRQLDNMIALNFKLYLGIYLGLQYSPPNNEEVTNPAYHTNTDDDHCKEPVEKRRSDYSYTS